MKTGRLLAAVVLSLAATAGMSQLVHGQQQALFRVNTDLVRVDVLVTDRGRPVAGLTAADFDVRDNGVPQKIQLAATAENVKVVLVLDNSGSVRGQRLEYLKRATRSVLAALGTGEVASLITFNEQVALRLEAEHDTDKIEAAVERLSGGGATAACDALYSGLSLVAQDAGRSLLLLFSDGGDNSSFLSRDDVIATVRRSMATVYVVGAKGSGAGMSSPALLQQVADTGGGNVLWAEDDSHLPSVFTRVLDEFRSRYLITYSPTGVRRDDGWHKIAVTLKNKPGRVKVRPGYFATPLPGNPAF
jgi:VWFA-related protein